MKGLQKKQLWLVGGALAAALLIVLAWFTVIGPEVSHGSSLNEQTASVQTQNTALQSKVAKLQADSANMAELNRKQREAQAALPGDSGLPDFIRQLGEQAATAGVTVASITTDMPEVAGSSASAKKPAKGGAPVAGSLYAVPITVVADGPLAAHRALLSAIERGPRRALIDSVKFGASKAAAGATGSVDESTAMTVALQVFVAPQTPAAQAELQKQLGG